MVLAVLGFGLNRWIQMMQYVSAETKTTVLENYYDETFVYEATESAFAITISERFSPYFYDLT
jgi:hypothetical protein